MVIELAHPSAETTLVIEPEGKVAYRIGDRVEWTLFLRGSEGKQLRSFFAVAEHWARAEDPLDLSKLPVEVPPDIRPHQDRLLVQAGGLTVSLVRRSAKTPEFHLLIAIGEPGEPRALMDLFFDGPKLVSLADAFGQIQPS
jgi:hypothetical protein